MDSREQYNRKKSQRCKEERERKLFFQHNGIELTTNLVTMTRFTK